ncbi:hypothetical protein H0H93_006158 [Arthromyces matolae]|nr:hypothetical protein H0H93_006158 [Arthromyces matolae]
MVALPYLSIDHAPILAIGLPVLKTLGATLTVLGVYKCLRLLYSELTSPLRDLPGPKNASWIYGNSKEIWKEDAAVPQEKWVDQYGPAIKYYAFFSTKRLFTMDTKAINHILMNSYIWQKPDFMNYSLSQIVGAGVLVSEGDKHKQQILKKGDQNPAFGPAQIRELTGIFLGKAVQLRDIWMAEISNDDNSLNDEEKRGNAELTPKRFDVLSWLSRTTLDIIGLAAQELRSSTELAFSTPGMATDDPASTRILRRAGNLLTSTGQPVHKELSDSASLSTDATLVNVARTVKLRASIKRKFKEATSLGRSKSVKDREPQLTETKTPTRHARSMSTAAVIATPMATPTATAPRLLHSITSPALPATTTKLVSDSAPITGSNANLGSTATSRRLSAPTLSLPKKAMDREGEVTVPKLLQEGTPMTKVSAKKHRRCVFRLDPDIGQIIWEGKQQRIIPIENIKELRSGSDARYYREQFQLAAEYEDRWLTIVYIIDGTYKTLHLIAASRDVFRMWDTTLRRLHAIRKELMSGLGNLEMRQAIWEKHYWKDADQEQDQKLVFDEVEKLCRRLNINSSPGELQRLFRQADVQKRNYLDFEDFRRFVKLLKGRPEIDRLYNKLRARGGSLFDFSVFERFMREKQESECFGASKHLRAIFRSSSAHDKLGVSVNVEFSFSIDPSDVEGILYLVSHVSRQHRFHGPTWAHYYVSSSHNTYLVGHQLVGISTIEGYIRALLHSCRSVELDIFDGDNPSEPQITHGKTFTSKVSLREVCHAIMKYGFVASPYPIIISAEIHCSHAGQDAIANIMCEVFGEALIQSPVVREGRPERLPSPEELKGRILLKAKNLYLAGKRESYPGGDFAEGEYGMTETSASASSSTSDSEAVFEKQARKSMIARREPETSAVKELKGDIMKAGSTVFQRVKSVGKSTSRSHSGQSSQIYQPPSRISPLSPSTSSGSYTSYFPSRTPNMSPVPIYPSSPSSKYSTPPSASFSSTSPTLSNPLNGANSLTTAQSSSKPKMSMRLLALLVYTVGVKYRGINKKEVYAPEHMFSLSENTANRIIKSNTGGMQDLIKHCRTHLVRVYPKGMRVASSNYEPHRYWSAGIQLVALNWQTFDLGYMINHAMFQRNGRAGYVLKPAALLGPALPPQPPSTPTHPHPHLHLRSHSPTPSFTSGPGGIPHLSKDLLLKHTKHHFDVSIISAQQLPRPKDSLGREIPEKGTVDPFVEVSIHVPDWPSTTGVGMLSTTPTPARAHAYRTGVVKGNGFNPVWEEKLRIPFECVGDMRDLIFVRFVVRANEKEDVEPLAVYCASLGSLGMGE